MIYYFDEKYQCLLIRYEFTLFQYKQEQQQPLMDFENGAIVKIYKHKTNLRKQIAQTILREINLTKEIALNNGKKKNLNNLDVLIKLQNT